MNKSFLAIILVALLPGYLFGQQYQRISRPFTASSFEQFVNQIEEQTTYHFYYDSHWTDSLSLNLSINNQPINILLDQIFSKTDLHYNIYQESIFITKERELLTELPVNFFNDGTKSSNNPVTDFDYSEFEQREKQKKLAEEKLYVIGTKTNVLTGTATLAGVVRDLKTGEPIIGAAIYIESSTIGTATDQFGYYSITLSKGRHKFIIKSIGMKTTSRQVMLYANGKLDIEIEEDITPLKEVVVESDRDARVTGMQMGMEKLDIRTMKQIPLALGETDIMKVVMTLPGVQTVGEGTVGLNVRGGATNQNLILYNDATIYNPSHLFGFFSTFNPDVLKNVELYKSGITADYGGRLSSVLDVHSREGNLKKISGSGGISPITGRISLEGPIIKDRTSFLLGFRSTYSDWILRQLNSEEFQNSEASFYDVNASLNHKIDDNNNIYFSAYGSKDHFKLNNDTTYSYSDRNASLKWKHVFGSKLYSVLTGSLSQYDYDVSGDNNPVEAFTMKFAIKQWNAKADFNYFPNTRHTITAGGSVTRYSLSPGNLQPNSTTSEVEPDLLEDEQAVEAALYVGENFDITQNLSIYAGLRYSFYRSFGPRKVYTYAAGVPKQESSIQDSVQYDKGEPIATYHGAEPRVSLRYTLSRNSSVKLSYNRMRQYIQMLSNTTAIAPTDIWKLCDPYVKPQIGDQISLGFYKNLRGNMIETSVEAYYKTMQNAMDFKNGAELLLNHHLETDILQSRGKAYGIEFLIKKSTGKLNGWVGYTYSRSLLKTKGNSEFETINDGVFYPSSYDKPHAVNFIGNYKFSRRINFSFNLTYSSGRPITLPVAKYEIGGTYRVYYSDRNEYRIPDYFRCDASINIEGNHKVKKLAHSSWTFAVYNLTGRTNAYSIYFVAEDGKINGYKLSIFGKPIPTITYNFKF